VTRKKARKACGGNNVVVAVARGEALGSWWLVKKRRDGEAHAVDRGRRWGEVAAIEEGFSE